jgi:2-(1,2-epoxy-1,2-dihydrophenyl)acetyl-CoA isomerase
MSHITFEIKDKVAYLRLNRPEVYNSFNRSMAMQMQELLDHCDENDDIRSVCITGNGKAFSAGQDLNEVVDPDGPELTAIVKEHYNPIIMKMRHLTKPIVVAVNGVAAGAGANIALAADIVIASESASFIQAFSKIGLIPDSGGTYTLPRLVGYQKAAAWIMLGDKISAAEAERYGMVYKVVADDALQEMAAEIAYRMASMPTQAFNFTKQALNASSANTLEQQLELEAELQTRCGFTFDYQEGVSAFLEKRKPKFIGK